MEKYKILIRKSAINELKNIPKKEIKKVIKRIQSLAQNPRPHGSQKLSAQERYRIRQGNYRIIYSVHNEELTVHVVKIGHRREIYRT
jgi:mRNA interferase RelE/StbE